MSGALRAAMTLRKQRTAFQLCRETGQATVEFALILPVLLILVLAVLDFGKAFNYWIDQTHLANAAARWAVVNALPQPGGNPACPNPQKIGCQMQQQADTSELRTGGASVASPGVQITFCFPSGTGLVGQPVRATAHSTYNWLKFLTSPLGISGLTSKSINATATMRIEAQYDNTAYTAAASC